MDPTHFFDTTNESELNDLAKKIRLTKSYLTGFGHHDDLTILKAETNLTHD